MDTNGSLTVVDALARVIATDATRPLVTYYDDATGYEIYKDEDADEDDEEQGSVTG